MADFKVARYTTSTNMPIQDGQVLVEKTSGLMSFDVGNTRVRSKYVYGTVKPISTNNWISQNGRYYIDITDLMAGELPTGYQVVGASMLTGAATITEIKNNQVRICSEDRANGNVLVFVLPYDASFNNTSSRRLVSLYHFEENTGTLVDCSGNTTIAPDTGWSFNRDYKYGFGSIVKSSIGYIDIQNIEPLDAFTIEWWQYDPSFTGDGGIVMTTGSGDNVEFPPISKQSSNYVGNAWKHIAMVRKSGSTIHVYVNGKLIGFTNIEGDLTGPVRFYGAQTETGDGKICYIDELAVFSYARYTENFDPADDPYVGDNEALITIPTDTFNITDTENDVVIEIPVSVSTGGTPSVDTTALDGAIDVVAVSGNTYTLRAKDTAAGSYPIIFRYPGSISKAAYILVANAESMVDDTMIPSDGSGTYAMSGNDRNWSLIPDEDDPNAITVFDGSDSNTVYVMENNGAEGADRVWSTQ